MTTKKRSGTLAKIGKALNVKRLLRGEIRFPRRSLIFFNLNQPRIDDLTNEVGDGTSSDVLMTPLRWLQRAMVEAPFAVTDADGEPLEDDELLALLQNPNDFYSGELLLQATIFSLALDGNAYWQIVRDDRGKPVELWYQPHDTIEPRWPDDRTTVFISHYEQNTGANVPIRLELEDVVHFREGFDPNNVRKGLSALKGLLREIWTDNEAAIFTASLLRNGGVPGVVISPSGDTSLTPEEADTAKAYLEEQFTRSNRGKPLVNLGPTSVEQFGFSPRELDLSPLRDISEERVCAALGVVAAVVGFGAGLQQTKVGATMKELRQLSWLNGVIPLQRVIGGTLTRKLASEKTYTARPRSVGFDNSNVEALRENQDAKAKRVEGLVRAGIWTRGEGRVATGKEEMPGDDVYLMPLSTIEVRQGDVSLERGYEGEADPKEAELLAGIKAMLDPPPGGLADDDDVLTPFGWVKGRDLPRLRERWRQKEHSHGGAEHRIVAAAPTAKAPRLAMQLAHKLDVIKRRSGPAYFEQRLAPIFDDLGSQAFEAARVALDADDIETVSYSGAIESKADLTAGDIAILNQIADAIDVAAVAHDFETALAAGYFDVSVEVSEAIGATFGIEFELSEQAQQNVMTEGGLRAGLVDLDEQSKEALFRALAEGRGEGLAGENLARFIRDSVKAGPWRDAATRARVIARTEGAHAANTATINSAREMEDTEHMQVFDNRAGFDDPDCEAADGIVVTIDEAEAMGLAHPNCTRSFVPINSLLLEEMGL